MSVTVTLDDGAAAGGARARRARCSTQGKGPEVWTVDRAAGALAAAPVVVQAYDSEFRLSSPPGVPEGAEIVALGVHKLDAKRRFASSKT